MEDSNSDSLYILGTGASGANDPEEEEEEDLAALIKRLRAAKPPAEVLKVCFTTCQVYWSLSASDNTPISCQTFECWLECNNYLV